MTKITFSILISTKNRKSDLLVTLQNVKAIIERNDVECLVYDDGSDDGTFESIKENFPKIIFFQNETSKGYIFCRNFLLNTTKALYAISLDDDANFLTDNPLEAIENHFLQNPKCGLISFRIFWGKTPPNSIACSDLPERVKGFVGCGHVWRMETWKSIPNYPEWFVFYGEEDFAAYQMFKNNIEIHYLPSVLVHHRVDVLSRKKNADYRIRLRRSFRSGWYLYFLFFPWSKLPNKLLYTLWIQIKAKTFKGDFKATIGIIQALFDVLINFPKLLKQSNRLTSEEYEAMLKLTHTKIYWMPKKETNS